MPEHQNPQQQALHAILANMTKEEHDAQFHAQMNNARIFAATRLRHAREGHPAEPHIAEMSFNFRQSDQNIDHRVQTDIFIDILYNYSPEMLNGTIHPIIVSERTGNMTFHMRMPIMLAKEEEGELLIAKVPEREGDLWWRDAVAEQQGGGSTLFDLVESDSK